jgi:hypothetical protein
MVTSTLVSGVVREPGRERPTPARAVARVRPRTSLVAVEHHRVPDTLAGMERDLAGTGGVR